MKKGLDELLLVIVNEILDKEGVKRGLRMRVEEIDAGVFASPVVTTEVIKTPIQEGDLRENTGMLVDVKVREVADGLLNKIMIKLHIDDRREVLISGKEVYESEILEGDVKGGRLGRERRRLFEEKADILSKAVKTAIESIIKGGGYAI
ncbi:MAG: hypothetical protein ACXQTS_05485 [Candidatus Methanospirareceae archaeon]